MYGDTGVLQGGQQSRQRRFGDRCVDQQRLGGVADAGPPRLGVQQDTLGHVQVGRLVHVDMAVPDAGLDGGHLGIAYDRLDQARSPRGITTSTRPRA